MTSFLKIATVAAASLLMILMFRSQPAKAADTYYQVASIHKTTPTSWRGNWYSYVNGRFCLTQINKYSVTQKYKGKKHTLYKSSWKGYRKLAVGKIVGTNRYTFNAYAKKAYHRTHRQKITVLRDYSGGGSYVDLFRSPVYRSYGSN
ncbi:hypothetical protein GKC44_09065 [Lactobacillus parabuchneri]|uniref:Uncharacterized protein n=1 Tax=Lentilactobacillus parabuchneri TaxID=152331 RepID=A0A844EES6_9LACO|nr:hypothetical protein [Lentilactobacillus parabuchneri]